MFILLAALSITTLANKESKAYYCTNVDDDNYFDAVVGDWECFYTQEEYEAKYWDRDDSVDSWICTACADCSPNGVCSRCPNADDHPGTQGLGYFVNMGSYCQFVEEGGEQISCGVYHCQSCSSDNYCESCEPGYYPNSGSCYACNSGCATCSGSAYNQCKSCKSGKYLRGGTCVTSCGDRYYTSGNECKQCYYTCKTCSGSASTQCLSCDSGYLRMPNGTCQYRSTCDSGQYKDGNYCKTCSTGCSTCSGSASNQCSGCKGGYYLDGTTCKELPSGCNTYDIPNQKCSVCKSGYLLMPDGTCKYASSCGDGYYKVDNTCMACATENCKTCTSEQCSTCKSGYLLMPDGTCKSGSNCGDGYYKDGNTCKTCDASCATCTAAGSCTTCATGYVEASYQNSSSCTKCPTACTSCANIYQFANGGNIVATRCYSCEEGYGVGPGNIVNHNSGGIRTDNKCERCPTGCSSCSYSDGWTCSGCFDGYLKKDGACVPEENGCGTGYYLDSDGKTCKTCSAGCDTCETSEKCTQCDNQHLLQGDTCVTKQAGCNEGYYPNDGVCTQCSVEGCKSCSNDECTNCVDGKILKQGACVDESEGCGEGYYRGSYYYNNNACESCPDGCKNCADESGYRSTCSECQEGYAFGRYNECARLIEGCTGYTPRSDAYYFDCNGCAEGYMLQEDITTQPGGKCIPVGESCYAGYYQDGNNCSKCSTGCSECSSADSCTTCGNGYLKKGNGCVLSEDCTGEWVANGDSCEQMPGCIGYDNGTCASCESGYLKKDGLCVPTSGCGKGTGYLVKGSDCIPETESGCGAGYIKTDDGWCNRIIYQPGEAAPLLTDDNNNSFTIIFKK